MKLHIQFILRRNKLPRRKEGIYLHSHGGVGDIQRDGAASLLCPQGIGGPHTDVLGSWLDQGSGQELCWCPAFGSCLELEPTFLVPSLHGGEDTWGSLLG